MTSFSCEKYHFYDSARRSNLAERQFVIYCTEMRISRIILYMIIIKLINENWSSTSRDNFFCFYCNVDILRFICFPPDDWENMLCMCISLSLSLSLSLRLYWRLCDASRCLRNFQPSRVSHDVLSILRTQTFQACRRWIHVYGVTSGQRVERARNGLSLGIYCSLLRIAFTHWFPFSVTEQEWVVTREMFRQNDRKFPPDLSAILVARSAIRIPIARKNKRNIVLEETNWTSGHPK